MKTPVSPRRGITGSEKFCRAAAWQGGGDGGR
jgi:hypothetical protein